MARKRVRSATTKRPIAKPVPVLVEQPSAAAYYWRGLTVTRARQHRLEIQLAHCSITDVNARAYVLGLFREVSPSGAAGAIDERLEGVITEFTQRRMFGGNVGEIFVLPASRSLLRTDMVLFAGLGTYDAMDRDDGDIRRLVAENILRTLIRTHVEDFATVLFGASSEATAAETLEDLLRGFVRGKLDADSQQNFRRIILCEFDRDRYQQIKNELFRLAGTPLFEDIELSITELTTQPVPKQVVPPPEGTRVAARDKEPIYLMVRDESHPKDKDYNFRISLLPPTSKAAIVSDSKSVTKSALDALLKDLGKLSFGKVESFGNNWAKMVLPDSLWQALPHYEDHHLIVVHDATSSRLPWETLHLKKWAPALAGGMSHRYLADNLSVAKYLEEPRQEPHLHVLLIVDPTETLRGAKAEARRITEVLAQRKGVRLDKIEGAEGTRQAIIQAITSGKYDVLHFAGHAHFDPVNRSQSGILCARDQQLTGADLSRLGNLPSLVFFNACEAGRLRGNSKPVITDPVKLRQESIGFAEAFLRGGVANFVGTYWPVSDDSAKTFGESFYKSLLEGNALGVAVKHARGVVHGNSELDWADYIHYGDYKFRVKLKAEQK
ncbi:MAG: CHAT domain-containing protein [Pirellulaceae bacterium]